MHALARRTTSLPKPLRSKAHHHTLGKTIPRHADDLQRKQNTYHSNYMKTILSIFTLATLSTSLMAGEACKKCCSDKGKSCAECCKDAGKTCGKDCCKEK
jgi:hypothetical protein